ncbi:MAG TPA: hypothetical protein VMR06_05525 [Dokdonella sp.]|uniref:hypothetical protein n=1 Tax=Dokdonella sp. TaxID=2291710 RepID=UPI002C468399|nr:hypothetical protein [Dokdonella sp.]HUD41443.1 hypothetical protein [Dokdonella sp.]
MRHTLLGSVVALALAAGVHAEPSAPLDLRFALSVDGRLVGSPRLRVQPGTPGEIRVEADDGGGYRFEVRADPPARPTDPPSIVLKAALHTRVDGAWQTLGEPVLQIGLDGQPASIEIGRAGGDAAHYHIEVTARPAEDRSPAARR